MISDALALVRADLLKLRRRRGLMALAAAIGIGSVMLIFTVNAIRHGSDASVLPAGGVSHFEDATDFIGVMGVVIAAMIGATAAAGDAEAGTLRDVIATGRSRLALFGSRAAAATIVTLALLLVSLVVAAIASVALAGSLPAPSVSEILHRSAAVLAFGVGTGLLAVALATLAKSRGPVIATVLALDVVVSQVLIHVSFLGDTRAVLPYVAFMRLIGDKMSGIDVSLLAAVGVTVAWAVAAVGTGLWWARRVEV
jgi:ABC-type transport system involved in multi-copper enzyme maturation permease subunit